MQTFSEVKAAANALPTKEKWDLFIFLASRLRQAAESPPAAAKPKKKLTGEMPNLPPLKPLHPGISKVTSITHPFTTAESEAANETWGFNDGPGSLAAMLGLKPEQVREHLGKFESKGYMNVINM